MYLSVLHDGTPSDVRKANQYKASYHSVEHGLLNYLYITNWINPKPIRLYFRMDAGEQKQLYPLLIEQSDARISRVVVDGTVSDPDAIGPGFVRLPARERAAVEVSME